MKLAVLLLGVTGGVFGTMCGTLALGVGGVGSAVGAEGSGRVVGLGLAAILLSVVGIVGGALAMAKPRFAGVVLLVAGVDVLISISLLAIVATPLLVVGGILALIAGRRTTTAETPAVPPAQPQR